MFMQGIVLDICRKERSSCTAARCQVRVQENSGAEKPSCGTGATRSVDLSNVRIRKAAVPRDQAAAHKEHGYEDLYLSCLRPDLL